MIERERVNERYKCIEKRGDSIQAATKADSVKQNAIMKSHTREEKMRIQRERKKHKKISIT